MTSPLVAAANAVAVFTVATSGTTVDARTGNVVPNTTTVTVSLYLRQGPIDSGADFPGVDTDTDTFEGYAVAPQILDPRIRPGTTGTLNYSGQGAVRCEVLNARYPYGTTGLIGSNIQAAVGDKISLRRFVNG